ncbi:DUF6404 family protein [Collimonas sp. NPDC087041]|uniref:DUF6404 family protein n=1 Tax=Collimonas sp. NPDC087041 TaxID=3363960 RepID=UPI00382E54A9
MPYSLKIDAALTLLAGTNIPSNSYAPWLHRLFWQAGLSVPPPHLASLSCNCLFFGGWFSVVWGGSLWFLVWLPIGGAVMACLMQAMLAGVAFGLMMALHYYFVSRRHHLPSWSDL